MGTHKTAVAVHRWLTEEMVSHNPYNINPSIEDLQCICKGQYEDLWAFFLCRTKSVENVHLIKNNVRLHSLKKNPKSQDPKLLELQQEEAALDKEVAALERAADKLETSCQEHRKQLCDTEASCLQTVNVRFNSEKSKAVLQLYGNTVDRQIERYSELKKVMDDLKSGLFYSEKPDSYTYTVEVIDTCQAFEKFLDAGLQGSRDANKRELVQLTQQLMSHGSPTLLLKSLEENLLSSLSELKDKNQFVDWQKDGADLKLGFNCDQENSLRSLQSLLQDLSLIHAKSKLSLHKTQKEVETFQANLEQVEKDISLRLEEQLVDNPDLLRNAKSYISLHLSIAKFEAAISHMKNVMKDFERQNSAWEEQQKEWKACLAKIEENALSSDRLACMIKTVAKRSKGVDQRIVDCQSKNYQILKYDLPSKKDELDRLLAEVQNPVATLAQELIRTPCWQLSPVFQEKTIFRFCLPYLAGSPTHDSDEELKKLLQALDAQRFLTPERVLSRCSNLQLRTRKQKAWYDWLVASKQEANNDWVEKGRLKAQSLERQVNEAWKTQNDELVPSLHSRMRELRKTEDALPDVQRAMAIWWEQPAQTILTQKKVQEQDVSVWRQKWRSAVAGLKTRSR